MMAVDTGFTRARQSLVNLQFSIFLLKILKKGRPCALFLHESGAGSIFF
jgi:hypothetical protein